MEIKLSELAGHLGIAIPDGSENIMITGVSPLETANGTDISFIKSEKFTIGISAKPIFNSKPGKKLTMESIIEPKISGIW